MVPDEQMAAILSAAGSLEQICHGLVENANASGGRDNISVILVQARAKPMRRGLLSRMLGQQ